MNDSTIDGSVTFRINVACEQHIYDRVGVVIKLIPCHSNVKSITVYVVRMLHTVVH